MHTPTCRRPHTHRHTPVFVLEIMGHLIYRHSIRLDPRYLRGDGLCFRYSDGITPQREEKSPWGFYLPRRTFLRVEANCRKPIQTFCVRETGKRRGGEEDKLPFLCSFPPNPPAPSSGGPSLSQTNPGGYKRPLGRGDLRETLLWNFNTMIVLTIFKL